MGQSPPNDPLFFLLHANLDRIWAEWELIYGLSYLPEEGAMHGHNLRDHMFGLGVTPEDVLDHRSLGYRYDTEGNSPTLPEPTTWLLWSVGAAALLGHGAWTREKRTRAKPAA